MRTADRRINHQNVTPNKETKMNSKLTHAILAACTLVTAAIAQPRPLSASGFVKLAGITGESVATSAPALAVLGMSLLPYAVALPFGNMLYVAPDVVTIWDSDLKLPLGLPLDVTIYMQKLSLSGAFSKAPMADTATILRVIRRDAHGQSSAVTTSACGGCLGGLSGRFRLPTQGGIVVGSPGDT
jgi:hypothetical protein